MCSATLNTFCVKQELGDGEKRWEMGTGLRFQNTRQNTVQRSYTVKKNALRKSTKRRDWTLERGTTVRVWSQQWNYDVINPQVFTQSPCGAFDWLFVLIKYMPLIRIIMKQMATILRCIDKMFNLNEEQDKAVWKHLRLQRFYFLNRIWVRIGDKCADGKCSNTCLGLHQRPGPWILFFL